MRSPLCSVLIFIAHVKYYVVIKKCVAKNKDWKAMDLAFLLLLSSQVGSEPVLPNLADCRLPFPDHFGWRQNPCRPKNESKGLDTALLCLKKSFIWLRPSLCFAEFSVLQNDYCRIILCCGTVSRACWELVLLAQLFLALPCLNDVSCDVVSLKNPPPTAHCLGVSFGPAS